MHAAPGGQYLGLFLYSAALACATNWMHEVIVRSLDEYPSDLPGLIETTLGVNHRLDPPRGGGCDSLANPFAYAMSFVEYVQFMIQGHHAR